MSARNWILLRGLVRGRGHWADFEAKFKNAFPHDSVEFIDLPGNGESSQLNSPLQIQQYAEHVRQHSSAIKNNQPVYILALSLGAMVVVAWLEKYPHEINQAFLVCTSAPGLAKATERFQPHNYSNVLKLLIARDPHHIEEIMTSMLINNPERRQQVMPSLVNYSKKYPIRLQNFVRQLWAAAHAHFPLKAPAQVTLIGSYGDRLVSPQCTLNLAAHWGLTPHMHATSGHDIPIDEPEWLIEVMQKNLK